MNCRSLVAHYDDIVEYLKNISVDFDIIALSETWFVPEKHNLSNYSLNNYTLYTSSRDNKTGGGVAIYAHDTLQHKLVNEISSVVNDCYESVFIDVNVHDNTNIRLGCIYRAPNTDIKLFNDELENILEFTDKKSMFLCGDFNIDLLKYESHQYSSDFVNQLFSYGYYPLINLPTRITSSTSTLIDNIFTNVIDVKMANGILINDISDHLPIYTMVDYKKERTDKYKKIGSMHMYIKGCLESNTCLYCHRNLMNLTGKLLLRKLMSMILTVNF